MSKFSAASLSKAAALRGGEYEVIVAGESDRWNQTSVGSGVVGET